MATDGSTIQNHQQEGEGVEETDEGTIATNNTAAPPQVVEEVLIFQCFHCLSIVGDSTHFVSADTQMKTITLSAVSCTTTSYSTKDLATSREGVDIGRIQIVLEIEGVLQWIPLCQVAGTISNTISRNHDLQRTDEITMGLLNLHTYYPFKCAHCQKFLGKIYKTTARALDHIRDHFTFESDYILTYKVGSIGMQATASEFPNLPTVKDYQKQEQSLVKMQHLLLLFKERLTDIEEQLGVISNATSIKREKAIAHGAETDPKRRRNG